MLTQLKATVQGAKSGSILGGYNGSILALRVVKSGRWRYFSIGYYCFLPSGELSGIFNALQYTIRTLRANDVSIALVFWQNKA